MVGGKIVPMHGGTFSPQNELKGWSCGPVPDPLQVVDPWSGTADGAGIKTSAGDAGRGYGISGLYEN